MNLIKIVAIRERWPIAIINVINIKAEPGT